MSLVKVQGNPSGTGTLTIAAPNTNSDYTITLPTESGTVVTSGTTSGISGSAISSGTVAEAYGGTGTSTGYYSFKNRLINGGMAIAQRGTSVSITAADQTVYGACDRWACGGNPLTARGDLKQSTDAPTGFNYSYELDVTTAGTPTSTYFGNIYQVIEGTNCQGLLWGTASAKSVTVSFWVKSNLTGNFTISLRNLSGNRSIFQIYTINAANTWEFKTITFPGDTSAATAYDTSAGVYVNFSHSADTATRTTTTQGSWITGSGGYALQGANPNIWSSTDNYIRLTGVQFEIGSAATSFDWRPYGTELTLCQRYCIRYGASLNYGLMRANGQYTTGGFIYFPNPMRATPSLTAPASSNFSGLETANSGPSIIGGDEKYTNIQIGYANNTTTGAVYLFSGGASAYLLFTSEL